MRRVLLIPLLLIASGAMATTTKNIPGGGTLDSIIETCAEGKIIKVVAGEPACADDDTGAGGADATAIHDNVAAEITAVADKVAPVAADHLLIEDSEAANVKKDITIGAMEAALEGVMDLQDMQGAVVAGQLPAGATLDTEWDTEAEVQTAWGTVNILLETEIDASSELSALMDDETGTGSMCFATSPTFTTGISIGSDGVSMSDSSNGILRLCGLGNGFDECMDINLDDTDGVIAISSSTAATTVNFSSLALQETGNNIPNATDTLAFFAATTSEQLATVISNESGTGPLLLQDTPTLVTPVIANFSGANHAHEGATSGGTLDGDALADTVGGAYITKDTSATPDEFDVDAEVATDDDCSVMRIAGGIADTDDVQTIFRTSLARTATRIWCETDTGTATINLQRDDGSAANMATANLACDATGEDACSSGCSTTLVAAEDNIAVGERVDLAIASVASTPVRLTVCLTTTKDD